MIRVGVYQSGSISEKLVYLASRVIEDAQREGRTPHRLRPSSFMEVRVLQISVRTNVDEILDRIGTVQTEQLPFAAARALTFTAREAAQSINTAMADVFDQPVAFTRSAVTFTGATKQNLTATLVVKDAQAKYLGVQARGGVLKRSRTSVQVNVGGVWFVPASKDILNASGNVPRGWIGRVTANKAKYHVGYAGGKKSGGPVLGIWEKRAGGGLKLLMIAKSEVKYSKRFDFVGQARRIFDSRFAVQFEDAMREAIATAR